MAEKMQRMAERTCKIIGEFLKLPEPETYEIKLVEKDYYEGYVENSQDGSHPVIVHRMTEDPLDIFMTISHELRHIYQMLYREEEYFSEYSTPIEGSLPSHSKLEAEKHNSQLAEIDANAFSIMLCETIFQVGCGEDPKCSEKVLKKIKDRGVELYKEYADTDDYEYIKTRFQTNPIFETYRESAKKYQ